jgi:chemotaxis protein CheD
VSVQIGTSSMQTAMPGPAAAVGRRLVVGIGDVALSDNPADSIVTHALGSCIAVCVFDPVAGVAGLLHLLLPESRINPARAQQQPAAFADTGIPLLLNGAYRMGAQKQRCIVHLLGGADVTSLANSTTFNIGRRNLLAARNSLWRSGVLIKGEEVGGSVVRTVSIDVARGAIQVTSGREMLAQL